MLKQCGVIRTSIIPRSACVFPVRIISKNKYYKGFQPHEITYFNKTSHYGEVVRSNPYINHLLVRVCFPYTDNIKKKVPQRISSQQNYFLQKDFTLW